MSTTELKKKYVGAQIVFYGDALPSTTLHNGRLFYKTGDDRGLHIYHNGWVRVDRTDQEIADYANIPLSRVGTLNYLPIDVKGDFSGAANFASGVIEPGEGVFTRNYFLREVDGTLIGLRPGYNGVKSGVFYMASVNGEYTGLTLSDAKYSPPFLLANEYVAAIIGGNEHGFAILIKHDTNFAYRKHYWVNTNLTLNSKFHTFVDISSIVHPSSSAEHLQTIQYIPELDVYIGQTMYRVTAPTVNTVIPRPEYSHRLEYRAYKLSGNTFTAVSNTLVLPLDVGVSPTWNGGNFLWRSINNALPAPPFYYAYSASTSEVTISTHITHVTAYDSGINTTSRNILCKFEEYVNGSFSHRFVDYKNIAGEYSANAWDSTFSNIALKQAFPASSRGDVWHGTYDVTKISNKEAIFYFQVVNGHALTYTYYGKYDFDSWNNFIEITAPTTDQWLDTPKKATFTPLDASPLGKSILNGMFASANNLLTVSYSRFKNEPNATKKLSITHIPDLDPASYRDLDGVADILLDRPDVIVPFSMSALSSTFVDDMNDLGTVISLTSGVEKTRTIVFDKTTGSTSHYKCYNFDSAHTTGPTLDADLQLNCTVNSNFRADIESLIKLNDPEANLENTTGVTLSLKPIFFFKKGTDLYFAVIYLIGRTPTATPALVLANGNSYYRIITVKYNGALWSLVSPHGAWPTITYNGLWVAGTSPGNIYPGYGLFINNDTKICKMLVGCPSPSFAGVQFPVMVMETNINPDPLQAANLGKFTRAPHLVTAVNSNSYGVIGIHKDFGPYNAYQTYNDFSSTRNKVMYSTATGGTFAAKMDAKFNTWFNYNYVDYTTSNSEALINNSTLAFDRIYSHTIESASGFTLYWSDTPVFLNGKDYTLKTSYLDLTAFDSNPANKTFGIYASPDPDNSDDILVIASVTPLPEAYNLVKFATVTTDSQKITGVITEKRTLIDTSDLMITGDAWARGEQLASMPYVDSRFIYNTTPVTLTVGPGKQFAHPQDAVDYVQTKIAKEGNIAPYYWLDVIIQLDDGTYIPKSGTSTIVNIVNAQTRFHIRGNLANPGACIFNMTGGTSNTGVGVINSMTVEVQGIYFYGSYVPPTVENHAPYTKSDTGILALGNSLVIIRNLEFRGCWYALTANMNSTIVSSDASTYTMFFKNCVNDINVLNNSSVHIPCTINTNVVDFTQTNPSWRIKVGSESIGHHCMNVSSSSTVHVYRADIFNKYSGMWVAWNSAVVAAHLEFKKCWIGADILEASHLYVSQYAGFDMRPVGIGGTSIVPNALGLVCGNKSSAFINSSYFTGPGKASNGITWLTINAAVDCNAGSYARIVGLTGTGWPSLSSPIANVYNTKNNSFITST